MSMTMVYYIKRWMAKRMDALVMEIIQGKTTFSRASRAFVELTPYYRPTGMFNLPLVSP